MEKKDFYLGSKEIKENALEYMSGSWGKHAKAMALMLVIVLLFFGGTIASMYFFPWYVGVICLLITCIVFILLLYGYNIYCLENTRLTQKGLSLIFAGFGKQSFKILFVKLVVGIITSVGFALLFIPGIYWYYGLSVTDFIIRDNPKLSTFGVIKKSFKLMKDNKWRMFKLDFSFIGWFMLVSISSGIASLWITPYYNTAKALFYEDLKTDF